MNKMTNERVSPIFARPLRSVHVLRHLIAYYRERENLTQEEFALLVKLDAADIQRLEDGDFSTISAQNFFDMLMTMRIDLTVSERPRPTAVDIEKESYARRFRERP